ncbi:hypothetical protein DFH06DRAFT_1187518 [Mycena polygramma]|nr:hypothetical protein DFH06DRAFT_1187518 [Mycena polygramma]
MSSNPSNESHYPLPPQSAEKARLGKQYALRKSVYGWSTAVPDVDVVDTTRLHNVLDIAAGTCMWTLDFAKMPQVRSSRDKIQIYACDINPGFLPGPAVLEEFEIKTFIQDVTKPFPAEYGGMFDLVHASLLAVALNADGWNAAVANFNALLKPGGILFLEELDPILMTEQQSQERRRDDDPNQYMKGSTWMHKANYLYTGFAMKSNFIVDLTFSLRSLLEKSGLTIEHEEFGFAPHGHLCRTYKGGKGASLTEYEDSSAESMMYILAHTAKSMLENGILEIPAGNLVTAQDLPAILEEVRLGFTNEGAMIKGVVLLARK